MDNECCDGYKHILYELKGKHRGESATMQRYLREAMDACELLDDSFYKQLISERLDDIRAILLKD